MFSSLPGWFQVKNTLFFFLLRGIKALVDTADLAAPSSSLGMGQSHNLVFSPMEVVGDKRHFPVEIIFWVQP
jgi:hypothetical protein